MEHPQSDSLLLYCRPGFEDECAKEIAAAARQHEVAGHARAKPNAGYVEFVPDEPGAAAQLSRSIRWRKLVFARTLLHAIGWQRALPTGDRVAALLPLIERAGGPFSAVWLETADTNEAKELSAFCRKFEGPLLAALRARGLVDATQGNRPRLHLFFTGSAAACIAVGSPGNASPWPMGIPRLRMPGGAPSRSTSKLAEALLHWLPDGEDRRQLHAGVTAVDLGAAPGGWTWQLVQRDVQVTAVDNGPMDPGLMATGLVDHERADAFRFRPRLPVGWMVCDIVEQPKRVAALVAEWLARGWCERCVFNLKLPMKQRHAELERCRALIDDTLGRSRSDWRIEFRHLYHDREEVTGYAAKENNRLAAARPARKNRSAPSDQARK